MKGMKKTLLAAISMFLAVNMIGQPQEQNKVSETNRTQCGNPTNQERFPLYSYKELPQLEKSDPAAWAGLTDVRLSWGDASMRYPATYSPAAMKKAQTSKALKGWRGERVYAQAVISTGREIKGLEYSISDLKGKGGVIPASAIEAGYVRFVMADELNKDGKSGCSSRPDHTIYDSSMVADVIDPYLKSLDMEPRSTRGLWLTVWIPRDIPAGTYKGTLTIHENGKALKTLKLAVEAENQVLPEPKDWKFHLDLWQNPFSVARYYQVPLWSKEHFDAMRPIMTRLANAGQKVITASIIHKPWDGQTEDRFESMISWIKKYDGTWEFRYDVFDAWVEFMMSCGITSQINCYSMAPWKLSFQYFDQASDSMKELHTQPGEKVYEDLWVTFLRDFAKHLKAKGWFDRTTIAMDERGLDVMTKILAIIRKGDKDFKLSLAGNYYPEIESELFDYCLTYASEFPADVLARRKSEGKFSTYYTCCAEPHPNTFTFSDPQEAFQIGFDMYRRNSDGYLRWAFNSWPLEPLLDSRFRAWASGDSFIVYPGNRTAIRFEQLVAGIQYYEKMRLQAE